MYLVYYRKVDTMMSYGIGMCVNMSRQYMGQTSADTDTGPKPETQN